MLFIIPMRILLVVTILLAFSHASDSWQRPQRNDDSSVADAVKYLQELDNYYSHLSRPRFGKRDQMHHNIISDKEVIDLEDDWQPHSQLGDR